MPVSTDSTRSRRARRTRRRLPALLFIVVVGMVAVAAAFALTTAVDDNVADRPHGPYLIGAWTFGDFASLDDAVKAGALDEVSVDWLQSRADGSVVAPRFNGEFLAAARREDCRVFVTLTDYDQTEHAFDPTDLGGHPEDGRLSTSARRGRRRVVPPVRRGRRRRGLGGSQGLPA